MKKALLGLCLLATGLWGQITTFPPASTGGGTATVDGTSIAQALTATVSSGSGTAYVLTPTTAIPSYAVGQVFYWKPDVTNTSTTPTANVSSKGAKTIVHKSDGSALALSELDTTAWCTSFYDGTSMLTTGCFTGPGRSYFICGTSPSAPPSGNDVDYCDSSSNRAYKNPAGVVGTYETREVSQSGITLNLTETSSSATVYTATMSPTLTLYTTNQRVNWIVGTSCTGGTSTTINIDGLGAKALKLADGTTNPTAADCISGKLLTLGYDGTLFRLTPGGSTSSGGFSLFENWFATSGYVVPAVVAGCPLGGNTLTCFSAGPTLVNLKVQWAGSVKNLCVSTFGTQSGLGSVTLSLMVNNVASTLVATVAASAVAGFYCDTTHTVSYVSGDLLRLDLIDNSATGPTILGYYGQIQ